MTEILRPFLKWPGGKRWLAESAASLFSVRGKYFEPFLGGGAVFFALQPEKAILSDINDDLVSAFIAVRDDPEEVIRQLSVLRITKKSFDKLRGSRPENIIESAVRLIFLNRTAFNGI
jgi:DNA adenine methylase